MGLDGEGDDPARREHARDRGHHRREVVDINENIRGEDQIVARTVRGFVDEESGDVGGGEAVIKTLRLRLGDHRRR